MELIDKDVILKYEDRYIELPEELQKDIKKFWENVIKDNPNLFDGENFVIESMHENENTIELLAVKSHYSHYLYNERVGIQEEKFRACSPWTGILLQTTDNYLVVGQMDKTTSKPDCLQIPGGQLDTSDINGDKLDLIQNLKRELKEEINIDLDTIDYKFKYLEYPNIKRNVYGFIALGKIDKTKDKLETHFKEYKKYLLENNLETEFEKLVFFKKENALNELDKLPNPKRPYLRELLKVAMQ